MRSHSGARALAREPGIHTHGTGRIHRPSITVRAPLQRPWLWIPGPSLRAVPAWRRNKVRSHSGARALAREPGIHTHGTGRIYRPPITVRAPLQRPVVMDSGPVASLRPGM